MDSEDSEEGAAVLPVNCVSATTPSTRNKTSRALSISPVEAHSLRGAESSVEPYTGLTHHGSLCAASWTSCTCRAACFGARLPGSKWTLPKAGGTVLLRARAVYAATSSGRAGAASLPGWQILDTNVTASRITSCSLRSRTAWLHTFSHTYAVRSMEWLPKSPWILSSIATARPCFWQTCAA